MDKILRNASSTKCYVDEVIIHSASLELHVMNLENVVSSLRKHELRVRFCKYFYATEGRIAHSRHRQEFVHTDDKKVQKISCAQLAYDAKELK